MRPYPNGCSGVGSRPASEIETSRNPCPPISLVTVTKAFAASAISTVRRLACAVPRDRATLRELVHVLAPRSVLPIAGSYPPVLAGTPAPLALQAVRCASSYHCAQ